MTDRFNALSALVAAAMRWPRRRWQRFHALFKDEALVLDKWFACRPAPRPRRHVLPAGAPADGTPGLQHPQPQPRAQRDLQLLQRQPRRLPPRRRGRLCVLERAGDRARRHQPAGGRPPGARAGPLEKLAEPYRSAAREAIARVAAKTDLSNDVREVVTARWPIDFQKP
jgi:aminopeptidase N